MTGPRTRVRLCGPLRLEIDGRDVAAALPGGQAATLLSYLLAGRERAADRDELVDAALARAAAAGSRRGAAPAAVAAAPGARPGDAGGP